MEIKIAADDMYEVLVNAGIDSNDAKAIIFDLMLAADGKFKPHPPVQQQARVQAPVARKPEPPAPEPEPESEQAEDPAESMRQPSRIRRKVVSFAGFGGPAEPLR
jgi:hypothetical protein